MKSQSTTKPPRMTGRRAAAILKEFNLYRRGEGPYAWTGEPGHGLDSFHEKYSVRELGLAIDHAVKALSKATTRICHAK